MRQRDRSQTVYIVPSTSILKNILILGTDYAFSLFNCLPSDNYVFLINDYLLSEALVVYNRQPKVKVISVDQSEVILKTLLNNIMLFEYNKMRSKSSETKKQTEAMISSMDFICGISNPTGITGYYYLLTSEDVLSFDRHSKLLKEHEMEEKKVHPLEKTIEITCNRYYLAVAEVVPLLV